MDPKVSGNIRDEGGTMERNPRGAIHEGIPAGSGETDSGREIIDTRSKPSIDRVGEYIAELAESISAGEVVRGGKNCRSGSAFQEEINRAAAVFHVEQGSIPTAEVIFFLTSPGRFFRLSPLILKNKPKRQVTQPSCKANSLKIASHPKDFQGIENKPIR